MQATTAVARAVLERSRAQGLNAKANAVLVYALGLPAATHLALQSDWLQTELSVQQELSGWLVQAQAQHPALIAARAQQQSVQEKLSAIRSEGLPTLDFTSSFYRNGRPNQGLSATQTDERTVGLTLNFPLFDGFARTYKIRGAQAQIEQKEAELNDAEHQILMEVLKAYADTRTALENLSASEQLQQAAQDALASVQRKFDRGAADLLDMLTV